MGKQRVKPRNPYARNLMGTKVVPDKRQEVSEAEMDKEMQDSLAACPESTVSDLVRYFICCRDRDPDNCVTMHVPVEVDGRKFSMRIVEIEED